MSKQIIISSVSGAGKTTLVNALLEAYPDLYRIKTSTSREVRPEENGDEYHFNDKHDMQVDILGNKYVESSVVYGEYYGISKEELDSHTDTNCIIILDVKGMVKFRKQYPDCITVFIEPPAVNVLTKRLKDRNTNEADVHKRINEIREEIKHINKYDHLISTGDIDTMKSDIIALYEKVK